MKTESASLPTQADLDADAEEKRLAQLAKPPDASRPQLLVCPHCQTPLTVTVILQA